jgi:hypothetical protein
MAKTSVPRAKNAGSERVCFLFPTSCCKLLLTGRAKSSGFLFLNEAPLVHCLLAIGIGKFKLPRPVDQCFSWQYGSKVVHFRR